MKIRAIGTGSAFCRHPLVTASFLIQSESSNILIGFGSGIPAKLETINLTIDKIDMWIPLNSRDDQVGGIDEIMCFAKKMGMKKPFLAAPHDVLSSVVNKFTQARLKECFELKAVSKVTLNEEHYSETITFVHNYLHGSTAYGVAFKEAEIFISGESELNEEFLHRYGMEAELVLQQCLTPLATPPNLHGAVLEEVQTLPIYLQQRVWLYGYGNDYLEVGDPLPMLFLPQGTCIYDSDRKDKILDKERFIRENSKRQVGNLNPS